MIPIKVQPKHQDVQGCGNEEADVFLVVDVVKGIVPAHKEEVDSIWE
jgi:hypothetical protein